MASSGPAVFLHKNGRLHTGPYATAEDNIITYSGGRGLTALVKLLEPLNPMLNYFELKILKKGEECAVGIGVGSLDYLQGHMPGWSEGGIGYHADDGHLYQERGVGNQFGPPCTEGDIMGCGISHFGEGFGEVFFTKNGEQVGTPQRMTRPVNGFYPLFGLHSMGEKIQYLGHRCCTSGIPVERMCLDTSPSTYWHRSNGIKFIEDGLTLEFIGTQNGRKTDIGFAQAIQTINRTSHYFEVTIISMKALGPLEKDGISIGLAGCNCHSTDQLGSYTKSVGYSIGIGKVLADKDMHDAPICENNDVIGCGIIFKNVQVECDEDDSSGSDMEPYSSEFLGENKPFIHFGGMFGGILPPAPFFNAGEFGAGFGGFRRIVPHVEKAEERSKLKNIRQVKTKSVTVYFTRNGETIFESQCSSPSRGLHPVIALCDIGDKVKVNLEPLTG